MLKNYFKIMFRNLLKRKAFTLINLLGLATGMAVCLLLFLYIQNELGYDNFHERGNQIYRLALERKYPGRSAFLGHIPKSIGQVVKMEFPEILQSTRVINDGGGDGITINAGNKVFVEKKIFEVDSNFFQVFTGSFLKGDVNEALQKPGTAIVNESIAKKYFGSVENAMGKTITLNESAKFTITGVCRGWPEKSHLQFNILLSNSGNNWLNETEYVYFGPYTYVLLNKNASAVALESKLPLIIDKYVSGAIPKLFGESYKQFVAEGNGYRYFLQPIKKIHLTSALEDELTPTVSIRIILLLGTIAAFILFLACVNFVNLSTALSVERAREVGIRKTFGSRKTELIWQFLSESILFSLISMVVAFVLVYLFTPLLSKISGNELKFDYFLQPLRLLLVFSFSILVGLVAGIYPALVLSSLNPMLILKGRFKSNRRGIALRNGLVIFQFSTSVILIICTIVVNNQMQYVLGDQLGFKEDHIITVERAWQLRGKFVNGQPVNDQRQSFINEISRIPGVEDITKCDQLPGNDESGGGATWVTVDNNVSRTDRMMQVDDKYLKLLDLQMKEGRFFSKEFSTDSLSVVINEKAAEDFGLKNPVGVRMICKEEGMNPDNGKGQYVFTIIGVIKDFHYQSLHKKIAPLIFVNSNKFGWGSVGVKIQGDHFKNAVAQIQQTWARMDPKHDFRFTFLDENVAAQYKAEETEQKIFTIFSLLAIIIACVGLFGLATYSTLQRTKEIGIRKVLGADTGNIVFILSKDFLKLVIISAVIAFPVAWLAMHKWLEDFAYHVNIGWWVFLLAGIIAAFIAFTTISFQTIKAAMANPVKSMRTE